MVVEAKRTAGSRSAGRGVAMARPAGSRGGSGTSVQTPPLDHSLQSCLLLRMREGMGWK